MHEHSARRRRGPASGPKAAAIDQRWRSAWGRAAAEGRADVLGRNGMLGPAAKRRQRRA